jgi:hypothetical protein
MSKLRSAHDPRLSARIVSRRPLAYRGGADATLDRPAHVRASSALCWLGPVGRGELVVLQDDAAFLGVIDVADGLVEALALPAGPRGERIFDAGRGNKADKPDFELAFAVPDWRAGPDAASAPSVDERLIAMGSGGLAARQRALAWRRGEAPQLVALPRLYAQLRQAVVGEANLNFEGGARWGEHVVLANRGGDGGPEGTADALVVMRAAALYALLDDAGGAPLPELRVHAVELGGLEPTMARLRFTDLAPRAGGLWFLAAAERTDNFYDDGEVVGSALGAIDFDGEAPRALRSTPVLDEHGALAVDKLEGVCAHQRADRLWAVTDPDAPDRAGELLELELGGPW